VSEEKATLCCFGCNEEWQAKGEFVPEEEIDWEKTTNIEVMGTLFFPVSPQICPECGSDDWGWL